MRLSQDKKGRCSKDGFRLHLIHSRTRHGIMTLLSCSFFSSSVQDPIKSQKPDDGPMQSTNRPGGGGKLGVTKGSLLKQYIMKKAGQMDGKDEDARAMILRHADEAAKSPMIFGAAYAETQPKPLFSQVRR